MKKLPFKPTALRRAAPKPTQPEESKESDDDGLALFRRAKEMAPIMAADRERRLKRHRAAELETERRRHETGGDKRSREDSEDMNHGTLGDQYSDVKSAELQSSPIRPSNEIPALDQPSTQDRADRNRFACQLYNSRSSADSPSELVTPPPSKRSRLSSSSSQKPILSGQLDMDDDPYPDASPTRRLAPSIPTPSRAPKMEKPTPQATQPITIDSDSDSDSGAVATKPLATLPVKRRSSSIELIDRTSTKPSSKEPIPPPAEEDEFAEYIRKAEEERARQRALQEANSTGEQKKETIEIMVSSEIPNASALKMRYLFTKSLRIAREAWIKHQWKKGLSLSADDVILTWRRKRVYNASTLISLGIRPAGDGRIEADGLGSVGFTDNRTVVHMEAWTPDLFQEMERNEELRRKRDAGELSDDEDEGPLEDERFKVVLKGRDMEPFSCTVRPRTTAETIITCFRQQRQIGSDKEVSLWWDGERLEEHIEMEQAEIEDMDTIEVHIQ
ncbi:hypothetical protein FSARC_11064 [Fusarium sarcochroum]|uniref:Rad60/SUMO-like domain-containing protein n=1 Tax=Fusarium sarcochroum TaxID=1208366 RepID=A0A8H4THM6_9HYPO|nr:hypothetical protein FSARC_11064 [Fusarium sarcochroum]